MTKAREAQGRQRRSGEELRELILGAAQALFGERGFANTTALEISRRAGVAEQSVYTHFGDKQGLYEAAVIQPFDQFVHDFIETFENETVSTTMGFDDLMRRYVEGLYDMVQERKEMFRALPPDHIGHASTQHILDTVESWVTDLARDNGYTFDPAIAVRSVFLLVTSMALVEETIAPRRDRSQITSELTNLLLRGLE